MRKFNLGQVRKRPANLNCDEVGDVLSLTINDDDDGDGDDEDDEEEEKDEEKNLDSERKWSLLPRS